MRDLSHDLEALAINSATVKAWSLEQLIDGCARAGITSIAPWRDIVQACGVERAAQLVRANGMTVTGLCRAGLFPAADAAERRAKLDDNRRAVDEAAAIGAACLVLIAGGLPRGSKDIAGARTQVRNGFAELLPYARKAGVALAIEPMHPMYAADRGCLNTMREANDLCDALGDGVGIAVDTYHVWWDPAQPRDRPRRQARDQLSRLRLAGADHRSAARPRHDGRWGDRPARHSRSGRSHRISRRLRRGDILRQ